MHRGTRRGGAQAQVSESNRKLDSLMVRIDVFALLLTQLMAVLIGGCDPGAYAASAYEKRVQPCHIEQAGGYNALAEISAKSNTVIGVDAVVDYKTEPSIAFDFPDGTLADLLDMFLSQAPGYRWDETDEGVVHVSNGDRDLSALKNLAISYPGAEKKTREEIWEDLANRPEISDWLKSAHCMRQEFFNGKEFRNHNGRISIPPGPVTLSQLLDKVAADSGENYWSILKTNPDGSCRISIHLW